MSVAAEPIVFFKQNDFVPPAEKISRRHTGNA
jgi:hypothetical protein